MKVNPLSSGSINPAVIALGLLAALLVFATLTGRKIPLIGSERSALLVLVLLGMAMCTQGGIGRVAASGAWLHPFSIVGYLLGGAILIIGLAALFGKTIPPLVSYRQSFLAVTAIAIVKLVITSIHRFLI